MSAAVLGSPELSPAWARFIAQQQSPATRRLAEFATRIDQMHQATLARLPKVERNAPASSESKPGVLSRVRKFIGHCATKLLSRPQKPEATQQQSQDQPVKANRIATPYVPLNRSGANKPQTYRGVVPMSDIPRAPQTENLPFRGVFPMHVINMVIPGPLEGYVQWTTHHSLAEPLPTDTTKPESSSYEFGSAANIAIIALATSASAIRANVFADPQ